MAMSNDSDTDIIDPLLAELRDRKSQHGTVMAVSMMKDEAPFLLEWFAHHLAVGFTDILVYTNDCSDGTVEMLQRLEELGLGYHRENNIPEGIKPQPSAMKHAQIEPLVGAADWVLMFDADEFLVVNHESGHLDGMLDEAEEKGANGIVITWRIFGSSGVVDWSRNPVSEQYLNAAPHMWNKGWGVKTLFKFDPDYWKLGIHRPSIKNKHLETGFPDTVHWLNGSGLPMEDYFKFRGWRSIRRTLGYGWAQMNHYAVKSVDSYAVRKFRGNVNNKKDKYNADYWSLQDRNEVPDRAILKHARRRREIMNALLTDPVLSELHNTAIEGVEARLAEYKQTEAYTTLRDSLIQAGRVPITEVAAKPPKARDPAKIAALMSRVETKESDRPKEERRNQSEEHRQETTYPYVEGKAKLAPLSDLEWMKNHDIDLPADLMVFSMGSMTQILSGRFDRRNARNIEAYIHGFSRVMDIGSGVAFIPMRMINLRPETVVLAHESREDLTKVARVIVEKNGHDDSAKLKLVDAPLVFANDAEGAGSGLAAYLKDFQPDLLRIAMADYLPGEVLAGAEMPSVRRVVIPFSGAGEQQALLEKYEAALKGQGFTNNPDRASGGSLQFDRS